MRVVRIVGEAELHDPHAGQTAFFNERPDCGRDVAEVLGYELLVAAYGAERVDECHSRTLRPLAFARVCSRRRARIERLYPSEMVYPYAVEKFAHESHTVAPPRKAVFLHLFPVVKRISPELAVLAEIIGRYARHARRTKALVEHKFGRRFPYIGAVGRDVYRNVADYRNAVFVGVCFQRFPLADKGVANEFPRFERCLVFIVDVPFDKALVAVCGAPRHEMTEILRVLVLFEKRVVVLAAAEAFRGFPEESKSLFIQPLELAHVRRILLCCVELVAREQTHVAERFQVDEIRIYRKRAERLIRRGVVVRKTERQDLPVRKSRVLQKIDEFASFFSERAA